MNLLVTGGAGFIGSTYVGQRIAVGDNVVVLDKFTYAGHKENLDWIKDSLKLTVIEGDICDGVLVEKLLHDYNIDAVVHFAAESHVDNSISSPTAFIETNIHGTYTMLEASRRYWKKVGDTFRFIHVSTDEVYGSLALNDEKIFTEDSPYKPNSPYSASKAAADHLARAWFHTYGLPTIVTNCSNNYGPRQHPEKLIPHMISCALSDKGLPVYGKGENIRDWIHVEDHCNGISLALTKGMAGSTYCFGGEHEIKNVDLVIQICVILDNIFPRSDKKSYKDQITFVTDRAGHDLRYAIDNAKSNKELSFSITKGFDMALKETVQWYLDNQKWCKTIMGKAA